MSILHIFTDGGARGNPGPAGIGALVQTDAGETVHQISQYIGNTTNNVAEYTAVITALNWLKNASLEVKKCEFFLDSLLVVEQVKGNWKIKEPHLQKLNQELQFLRKALPYPTTFTHVPRARNFEADQLVNQAIDAAVLS